MEKARRIFRGRQRDIDMTEGSVFWHILTFALPLLVGNIFQQLYNMVDTWVVGNYVSPEAFAAVGNVGPIINTLIGLFSGLASGAGVVISQYYGARDYKKVHDAVHTAIMLTVILTVAMTVIGIAMTPMMLNIMGFEGIVFDEAREYLTIYFAGVIGLLFYNMGAGILRAVGDSKRPFYFLLVAAVTNTVLDLVFVLVCRWGVEGAAAATVLAQWLSGIGTAVYTLVRCPELRARREERRITGSMLRELLSASVLTCLQQSVMNLGILMVQGRINSFGPVIMAAFAAAVKIDSFAYMPLQDFGNAFSTFIAQNYGAQQPERIRRGIRTAVILSSVFAVCVSACVVLLAAPLLGLFLQPGETEILQAGVTYLRIAGAFYVGIGGLFLLYGLYRAVGRPGMSLVLTVISLGTRVALAYALSAVPAIGVVGIWWSIPIGWALADLTGVLVWRRAGRKLTENSHPGAKMR